jgi:ribokinase
MGRVIVVGSVNVDLVGVVERLPLPGETVIGARYEQHHGGKGGNASVAAARLGASVVFVGAVGADAFGAAARAALEADGVDVSGLVELADQATGVALILVDGQGENVIAVAGGANAALTSVQVRTALKRLELTAEDVVLVGHEIRTGATHEALRLGRNAKATTILNPAPAEGLPAQTLALADVLTPNRGELEVLAGPGVPAARARTLIKRADRKDPKRAALVSLGADGALLLDGSKATTIKAPSVEAVDAVGAGDTLNGALAAGLASGLDLETAARRAVLAASLAVTRRGAREGMPTAKELDAAVRRAAPRDARRDEGKGQRQAEAAPASSADPPSSAATQIVAARAAGVIPSSSASVTHQAANPLARARSAMVAAPPMSSVFDQTSAQAGSAPSTVTDRSPPSAGSPVRGSRRWWAGRPSRIH